MTKQAPGPKRSFSQISDAVKKDYENFVLETVNGSCLRMAVMQGDYCWHYHDKSDELFIVLEGELKIEFKNREAVYLQPGEFLKIPAKTIHKTSAKTRTVNLCFEKNEEDTIFVD